jgi:hypothetical protein
MNSLPKREINGELVRLFERRSSLRQPPVRNATAQAGHVKNQRSELEHRNQPR